MLKENYARTVRLDYDASVRERVLAALTDEFLPALEITKISGCGRMNVYRVLSVLADKCLVEWEQRKNKYGNGICFYRRKQLGKHGAA
jgi:hypothetical protein